MLSLGMKFDYDLLPVMPTSMPFSLSWPAPTFQAIPDYRLESCPIILVERHENIPEFFRLISWEMLKVQNNKLLIFYRLGPSHNLKRFARFFLSRRLHWGAISNNSDIYVRLAGKKSLVTKFLWLLHKCASDLRPFWTEIVSQFEIIFVRWIFFLGNNSRFHGG